MGRVGEGEKGPLPGRARKKSGELPGGGRQVIAHSRAEPLQRNAYKHTFIKADEKFFILRAEGVRRRRGVDIAADDIEGQLVDAVEKILQVYGAVNVQNGVPAAIAGVHDGGDAVHGGIRGAAALENCVHPLLDDQLQKGGDILEVIVKGVPVYLTAADDVLDGDAAVGLLVQKTPERVLDCVFCAAHGSPALCVWHLFLSIAHAAGIGKVNI